MKPIDLFRTASSNMLRSKIRSLLTIAAIFIGAFTLTLTNGIGSGVSAYIDKQLGNIGAENVLLVRPEVERSLGEGPRKYDPESSDNAASQIQMPSLEPKDVADIASQPGIVKAEPIVMAQADFIQFNDGEKYEINLQPYVDGIQSDMEAGKLPDNNAKEHQLVIPGSYVNPLGLGTLNNAVGKVVAVGVTSSATQQQTIVEATIVGVQAGSLLSDAGGMANSALTEELYERQTAGLPDALRDRYFGVSAFMAEGVSEQEIETIKEGLSEKGYNAATIDDQIGIIKQVIDAIVMVLNIFAAIALLAASFGIVNTLFMAVQERTKEIGLMKAMGMRSGKVFALFSIEAILLGFWGSLIGSLAGVGVGQVVNRIAADTFLKDLPGFNLMAFSVTSVLTIMLIVMAIGLLAGTLPARRASQKDPIEALRYE